MDDKNETATMEVASDETTKLAKAAFYTSTYGTTNPWGSDQYDKLDVPSIVRGEHDKFKKLVESCRFFYKHDPLAATTINKLIDIGITPLIIDQGTLSVSEYAAILSMADKLQEFLEVIALEYLVSGLVIPDINYKKFNKKDLTKWGVKRFTNLILPDSLSVRDSATIKINHSMLEDHPSYFIKIPDKIVFFIESKGTYDDGTTDKELYEKLTEYYPDIVDSVNKGVFEIPLENTEKIIRGKHLSDSPYPIPYLSQALESLKHKRNIRRMDYSIASRVISAIQHVTLGSDDFPVVEGEEDQFESIREQMRHRYSNDYSQDMERIFQLFTNHTVHIEWIFPDVEALLDDSKYKGVNQDIIFGLGFPRILITGESERTGTSDPQYAMMSPQKSMETLQRKLLPLIIDIIYDVIEMNGFKGYPDGIRFSEINLREFGEFSDALAELYKSGNLSRQSYAEFYGYNSDEEFIRRSEENKKLKEFGLTEYGPVPFSPSPNIPGQQDNNQVDQNNNEEG